MKKVVGYIFVTAWLIYFVLWQIMAVIFFIKICKAWDSVSEIIFLGILYAEFKGLLWPYYIFELL